jgi:hypothetical protein
VRAIGLPEDLFVGVSEKLVTAWRARTATQYPSHLQVMAQPVRLTLIAALCWQRAAEITDGLVDLLIQLVHRINARAESRVEGEMVADLRRVAGKQGILFRLAGAALAQPDETVRRAIYPVVGEGTLRDLVREAIASEAAMKCRIRTVLRSSYSNHYRRMLPQLLAALEFRCNNTAYRPVMEAIELVRRYAGRKAQCYDAAERVPFEGVVPSAWQDAVVDEKGRVERIPYELCLLGSLRDALRRREVWVVGAAAGATRKPTCPRISRPSWRSTTPPSGSPSTRTTSSSSCAAGSTRPCATWRPPSGRGRPEASTSPGAVASPGSTCPAWTSSRSRPAWVR